MARSWHQHVLIPPGYRYYYYYDDYDDDADDYYYYCYYYYYIIIIIMYHFIYSFPRLEHIAHYKAHSQITVKTLARTQHTYARTHPPPPPDTHTHTYTHTGTRRQEYSYYAKRNPHTA